MARAVVERLSSDLCGLTGESSASMRALTPRALRQRAKERLLSVRNLMGDAPHHGGQGLPADIGFVEHAHRQLAGPPPEANRLYHADPRRGRDRALPHKKRPPCGGLG